VQVIIDAHEVHQLADEMRHHADTMPGATRRVVKKVGYDMHARTQANIIAVGAVDTGFMLGSVSIDFTSLGFDLGPTAEYGGYVELGVDHPFEIRAHPGGFLAFEEGGEEVFARKVIHPPIPPRPYLGPAFDLGLPDLERALGALGADVFRG
jgi:hypothetical protein